MQFTPQQLTGLNAAYIRKQRGQMDLEGMDERNLAYAEQQGWKPTGTSTIREPDGSVGTFDIDKLTKHKTFLQAAKDVIKIKQGGNRDIRQAKDYWRTIARDTTPFGGMRDEALQKPGFITDERLRELSPAQQASVRSARFGAAQAHLQGLSEEEAFRETRMSDTINALTDMMAEQGKLAKSERDATSQALSDMQKRQDLGLPLTDEDYRKVGTISVDGRTGGSVSWRHNNPLNIKFGSFAKPYGATQGQKATDGGSFAVFPDLATGVKAAKDLLQGKNYRDLSLDAAMKRWSNNGYTATDLFEQIRQTPVWAGKSTGEMTSEELDQLMQMMQTREGWTEGTALGSKQDDDMQFVADSLGLTIDELAEFPPKELEILLKAAEETSKAGVKDIREAQEKEKRFTEIDTFIQTEKEAETQAETIRAKLTRQFGSFVSSPDLDASMIENGYERGIFGEWSLKF